MSTPSPVPSYFGPRYIVWLAWTNAVTILAVIQGIVATLMMGPDDGPDALFTHSQFRYISIANAVLTVIIAQIKRSGPPPSPPTRALQLETPK